MSPRKVKVSKNRKKSWKKHSNIDEIEEFLEDKRLDERVGKDESQSNSLFYIEKSGTKVEPKKNKTLKEKKQKKILTTKDILKNLKAHKSLESKSAVKPFFNSKSCAPQIPKKLRSKNLKKKVEKSKEQRSKANEEKVARFQEIDNPVFFDLWNESETKVNDELAELENIQNQLIGKNQPKISEYRYQKPSLVPAVEIPHPGTSYNPSFESHQDLLAKAHEIEVKKVREEAHLKRVLDDYVPNVYDAEEQWMTEMTQGLNEIEGEGEGEDGFTETNQLLLTTGLKVTKRKLKAQRKREERQKALQLAVNARKEKNRRENQVYNLRKIEKEIKEAEEKSRRKKKVRDEKQIAKMFTPGILSKHKFTEPEIELNLTEEIAGNLRSVITDGDLLKDRFASLQKRNIIEPRVRILKHRKKHVKYFVKKHCRD